MGCTLALLGSRARSLTLSVCLPPGHKDYSQPPVAHSKCDPRGLVSAAKGWPGAPAAPIAGAAISSLSLPTQHTYSHTLAMHGAQLSPSVRGGLSPVVPQLPLSGLVPAQAPSDVYREYRRAVGTTSAAAGAPVYVATTQPTYLPPAHQVNPFTSG